MANIRKRQGALPREWTPSLPEEHRAKITEHLTPEFLGNEQNALLRAMDIAVDAAESHVADTLASTEGATLIGTSGGQTVEVALGTKPTFAELALESGASLVGFKQDGISMVLRTLLAKGREIVHAADRGLVGDGSNETTALQQLLDAAAGKVLFLGLNKSYGYDPTVGLTIPANTTIFTNGSKFVRTSALAVSITDAHYNFIVGDNVRIDRLEVAAVGGASDIGGVLISGSYVDVGLLKVTSPTAGTAANGGAWNAVRIGPNSGTASFVTIRGVEVANFDRAVVIQNIDTGTVANLKINTYRRGVYVKDCSSLNIIGGRIYGLSPSATGAAGDNGILLESTISHGSLNNIRIDNVTVEDSGEHGYRLGGALIARNIWYTKCHAKNPGAANSGVYPPANNGGCGFKALGPTAVLGARHQNIHYIDCSVEEVNATSIANLVARGGKSNFAGFQLGKVFGGSIVNPVVLKRPADSATYAETGNSCFNGIEIIGCQKITVTNPQIQRPYNSGIYIYDFSDGVNDWGQTDDVEVLGGHIQTPGVAGVEIDCSVITMRRISIQGHLAVNAGQYTMKVAKSGTGAFVNCWASLRAFSPTVETLNGLGTDWVVTMQGNEVGANACTNGSTWQSATAGTLRVRKAGAWASL